MIVEVSVPDEDKLNRELWSFNVWEAHSTGIQVVPRLYAVQSRPSRRHKWVTSKQWASRRDHFVQWCDRPPIPESVRSEVTAAVLESIVWVNS